MTIDDLTCSGPLPLSSLRSDSSYVADDRPDLTGSPVDSPAPWRPWFLGDAPAPVDLPVGEAGVALMAAELGQLRFLRWVHCLLDFVGEGCRLTKQGKMFAVDRRALEAQCIDTADGFVRSPDGTSSRFELAWVVLTGHGWLSREEGWVRPTGRPLARTASDIRTDDDLVDVRRLLAAALDGYGRICGRFLWSDHADEDVLDALLVASGPEGLRLPSPPADGALAHCAQSQEFLAALCRHPYIRDVPRDPRSGHVADSAVGQLTRTSDALHLLVDCGLLDVDGEEVWEDDDAFFAYCDDLPDRAAAQVMRGSLLLRGAVALLRGTEGAVRGGTSTHW